MATSNQIITGNPIAEGKTKEILSIEGHSNTVLVVSKDDITAGDGAKHDAISGKAAMATQTTCNVFNLLKYCGIPVAFERQYTAESFIAPRCQMLPYEVVARREAHGSYLKRMPDLVKGHLFQKLLVEFFLKTKDRRWKEHQLLCDDPLMTLSEDGSDINLYEPSKPIQEQKPFLVLSISEVFSTPNEQKLLVEMEMITRRVFFILEKAWQIEGRTLVDFKVEFGIDQKGSLLLADVIDNDSWRVLENGQYIDKQVYRDGGELDDVAKKYHHVAHITENFSLPEQQIIFWCESEGDSQILVQELIKFGEGCFNRLGKNLCFKIINSPLWEKPDHGIDEFNQFIQQTPDSISIAYVSWKNGISVDLPKLTTAPVITVPTSFEDFAEGIQSSNILGTIVVKPSNAVLVALKILASNNPLLYMFIREHLEKT